MARNTSFHSTAPGLRDSLTISSGALAPGHAEEGAALLGIGIPHPLADLVYAQVSLDEQTRLSSMPDGTPRKCLDISRITSLGWQPTIELEAGLQTTYRDVAGSGALDD